jgi:hypothetical protein
MREEFRVNKDKSSDTGTGKHMGRRRTGTAAADNPHGTLLQARNFLMTKKFCHARVLLIHVL